MNHSSPSPNHPTKTPHDPEKLVENSIEPYATLVGILGFRFGAANFLNEAGQDGGRNDSNRVLELGVHYAATYCKCIRTAPGYCNILYKLVKLRLCNEALMTLRIKGLSQQGCK